MVNDIVLEQRAYQWRSTSIAISGRSTISQMMENTNLRGSNLSFGKFWAKSLENENGTGHILKINLNRS